MPFKPLKPIGVPNRSSVTSSGRLGSFSSAIQNVKQYKEGVPQVEYKENPKLAEKARKTFF